MPGYSWSPRLQKEETSFSSGTALHKGREGFWLLHSSTASLLLRGSRHRCLGRDEQQIPQEMPGMEKPGDLMDSVLHGHHSMSGVTGRAPPSQSYSSPEDLAGQEHGLWGQNRVVLTYHLSHPAALKKNRFITGKKKMVKILQVFWQPNRWTCFQWKGKSGLKCVGWNLEIHHLFHHYFLYVHELTVV